MRAIVPPRSSAPSRAGLQRVPRWPGVAAVAVKCLLMLALAAVLGGLGGCAWLADQQSRLALRPTPSSPPGVAAAEQRLRPGDERWLLPVPPTRAAHVGVAASAQDQLALWWLPADAPDAPALLYLHGTFRNLYQNLPKIEALRAAGYAVLAVDYRGWGDSTAIVPDEETIAADARVAWAELQRRVPQPERRYVFGHSMGGAVAVRLASTLAWPQDYAGLIVESSFTRMPEVAAEAGFWGRVAARVTTLAFDAIGRIDQVRAPLLMLHGSADRTVPVALGRRLRDAALAAQARQQGPACVQYVEFEGGSHSHLHREFPQRYAQTLQGMGSGLADCQGR